MILEVQVTALELAVVATGILNYDSQHQHLYS